MPAAIKATNEIATNIRLYFMVDFMFTYPGPKNRGDGTDAEGVQAASAAANAISTVNAAMLYCA